MSDLEFTQPERELIENFARYHHSVASRLGFYGSVLVPVLLFGSYGVMKQDFVAVTVSLIGLLIFVWWRISHELVYIKIYQSIFQKILKHEQAVAAQPTESVGSVPQRKTDHY
jgi:hypothetical protein